MVEIDARLDNGKIEEYGTSDGGNTWTVSTNPHEGVTKEKPAAWRVRTDAATHSYVIEKSENNRWQKVASFLVNIASCTQ